MTRHEELRLRLGTDDPLVIAKAWHRFEPLEQFVYREALRDYVLGSGPDVEEWEREMYLSKDLLRKVWVELEKRGEAEEWVKGVGEGDRANEGGEGRKEWVEVMRRMKKWGDERGLGLVDRTKL